MHELASRPNKVLDLLKLRRNNFGDKNAHNEGEVETIHKIFIHRGARSHVFELC